jgi:hypothetical protein
MTRSWRQAARKRPAAWLLVLLLVLFIRAAVPQGWMLDTGADGRLTVTLCDGMAHDAPMTMSMMMPGHRHDHRPADQAPDHPCAFAGAAMAAALPGLAPLALPAPITAAPATLAAHTVAIGRGLAAPPPPPTGPPAFA